MDYIGETCLKSEYSLSCYRGINKYNIMYLLVLKQRLNFCTMDGTLTQNVYTICSLYQ